MEEGLLVLESHNTIDLKGRVLIESKKVWRVAFPSMLSTVTSFGSLVVTQIFIGHLDALELATYALIQSLFVRFINGILLGMSSATETMCGQAFGAGHYHMLGIYLQRSWIINLTTATLFLPLFLLATPIFRLLGQEEEIAVAAGSLSLWFIPFVYYFVFSFSIQQFLQAQLKNLVIGCLSSISFVFHVFVSWIFVSKLDWGVPGAMVALIMSSWSLVFGEFVYIFGGWCPNTWKGFTRAAFIDLCPVIKLSISSGGMLCLELWYTSVLVLIAGYMADATVAVSAFSMCLNISTWDFMFCLGFLAATCVRVANELGGGNAKAAKFSIKVILGTSICFGVVLWIMCLVFGRDISYLLISSEEIAEYMASLSVLLAFSVLLNSVQLVLSGAAVGAGRQSSVAFINIVCYYVIGIPLGALLAFVVGLEIKGLWIGMLCGVATQTLALGFMTWRTNWDDQVKMASERLNRWFLEPSHESNQTS